MGTAAPDVLNCSSTQFAGNVNGIDVCVDAVSKISDDSSVSATPPAGSSSSPSPLVDSSAPAGATGSSTQTVCTAGSCNTTTIYTNSSGAPVGTKSETKPESTFCGDNPGSPLCKTSSYSAAACGSAPACSGDAIQCGIAANSWATACALSTTANSESALFDAEKGKTGSQVPVGETVAFSSASFSTTDLLSGSASGLTDLSITVWNKPVNIPFSNLNQYLSIIGNVLMAVAFILSVRIVRGA